MLKAHVEVEQFSKERKKKKGTKVARLQIADVTLAAPEIFKIAS